MITIITLISLPFPITNSHLKMQFFTCSSLLLYTITPLLADALSLDINSSGQYYLADQSGAYYSF